MPLVTAFIDDMREAFGKEEVDGTIKGGMQGLQTFWAEEGGHSIGRKADEPVAAVCVRDMVLESNADALARMQRGGK